jgi:hypothetical protein
MRVVTASVAVAAFSIYPRGGASDMSIDNVRPEPNLLSAFTLTIVGAFAAGLPRWRLRLFGFVPEPVFRR